MSSPTHYLNDKASNEISTDVSSGYESSTDSESRSSSHRKRDESIARVPKAVENGENKKRKKVGLQEDSPEQHSHRYHRKRSRPDDEEILPEEPTLSNRNLQTQQDFQPTGVSNGNVSPHNQVVSEALPLSHQQHHFMPTFFHPYLRDLTYGSAMLPPPPPGAFPPTAGLHQQWTMQVHNHPFQSMLQVPMGAYDHPMNMLPVRHPGQTWQETLPEDDGSSKTKSSPSSSGNIAEEVRSSSIKMDQQESLGLAEQGAHLKPNYQLENTAFLADPNGFAENQPLTVGASVSNSWPEAITSMGATAPGVPQFSLANASSSREAGRKKKEKALLFMPCDVGHLSEYQVLIRKQLEIFEATEQDITQSMQGRKKQLYVGQVGVRCIHCKNLPLQKRGRGSVYFPAKLDRFYQAAQNMASTHLCLECKGIDPNLKTRLAALRGDRAVASGGKRYWADSVRVLGCYEDPEDGVRRYPWGAIRPPSASGLF
mmetsp:Transcript_15292/g.23811  ORF Transcript_15292/g.23811 Transcript_15292/m.23811 type:complete len:484 (-) Transcript_15292:243-1694(-)|eukprot:CAMPEP_0195303000 /NCGR_PEP_ID=MMETSP0707-20130614/32063_1 /TAXON_ID=33640 /ORGANISM="Asterionellopsis glacialis, Strain CCMP134" /LENGTH=483 /DNA_ID=CAMNT_0040366411 /DNA_START=5 /DNA_END=1456 /DNA_ORIENTATION=+